MFSIFGGSSSPFDHDVEKVTNEKNTTEEWGQIMLICDKAKATSQSSKDCLRSIMKRLGHQDPHVALQACTLLDACVKNSGRNFLLEVASRDFEQEYKKLIMKSHQRVSDKMKELLQKWAEGEFKTDPQLSLIPAFYQRLRAENVDFTPRDPKPRQAPVSRDPNVVTSQEEEDDLVKAITLSLKEVSTKSRSESLYPSTSGVNSTNVYGSVNYKSEARKVRALYDFEAAEDNELTFSAGELIHVLDDSDSNWWKGYNKRGEGLFPANFVTADLSAEPDNFKVDQSKKVVQFSEEVSVQLVPKEAVEINEDKIDRLRHLLHEANPEEDQYDTPEMLDLEDQVNAMGPLIDNELERVDRKHAQLTQLSADLVEALNLYHTLMREPGPQAVPTPYHAMSKGPPYGYQPMPPNQPHMYNGGAHGGPHGVPHGQPHGPPHGGPGYSLPPDQFGMQSSSGQMSMPTMPQYMNQRGPQGPESMPSGPVSYQGGPPMFAVGGMVGYPHHPQYMPPGPGGPVPQGPPQGQPQTQGPPMSQPPPPGTFSPPNPQLL